MKEQVDSLTEYIRTKKVTVDKTIQSQLRTIADITWCLYELIPNENYINLNIEVRKLLLDTDLVDRLSVDKEFRSKVSSVLNLITIEGKRQSKAIALNAPTNFRTSNQMFIHKLKLDDLRRAVGIRR